MSEHGFLKKKEAKVYLCTRNMTNIIVVRECDCFRVKKVCMYIKNGAKR